MSGGQITLIFVSVTLTVIGLSGIGFAVHRKLRAGSSHEIHNVDMSKSLAMPLA